MKHLVAICALFAALSLFAERQPYERYQSIVARQMFGDPPPGFDPAKPPSEVSKSDDMAGEELTKEQEQIKSAIHFSVINVTPGGETAVGFTDNGDAKNPIHYYLKVGESRNGWTVKAADPVKATMTIAKGEIEVSLSIGGNSASQPGAATKAGQPAVMKAAAGAHPAANAPGSLRGRRILREQQRQELAAKEAAEKAEENAKREAERQRDEEEKAQRDAEREEQRAQLLQIQEELRKAREARAAREAEEAQADADEGEAEE
jgi:hypothetical protein